MGVRADTIFFCTSRPMRSSVCSSVVLLSLSLQKFRLSRIWLLAKKNGNTMEHQKTKRPFPGILSGSSGRKDKS